VFQTVYPLMFDSTGKFGKCGPIFKILSLIDLLCIRYTANIFTLPAVCCCKFEHRKILPNFYVERDNC